MLRLDDGIGLQSIYYIFIVITYKFNRIYSEIFVHYYEYEIFPGAELENDEKLICRPVDRMNLLDDPNYYFFIHRDS